MSSSTVVYLGVCEWPFPWETPEECYAVVKLNRERMKQLYKERSFGVEFQECFKTIMQAEKVGDFLSNAEYGIRIWGDKYYKYEDSLQQLVGLN
jgi:hypothetical protein